MERKGISPVIATVLLIGVAVFAAGAIFTFTQGQIGNLRSGTGAPSTSVTIDAAAQDMSSAWCTQNDGIILINNEGDSISLDDVEISIRTDRNPRPVTLNPTIAETWDPGQKIAFHDISGNGGMALPDKDICQGVPKEGNNDIQEGDLVNVVVTHKPTDSVVFEDSRAAVLVVNSFI